VAKCYKTNALLITAGLALKIKKVEPILCQGGCRNWVFVKVTTDEGVTGWGDGTDWFGEPTIANFIEHLAPEVVGEDAFNIERLWQKMYSAAYTTGRIVNCAITAIETALWDIVGKALETPVYNLLGGRCRERVLVYYDYCDAYGAKGYDYVSFYQSGDRSLEGIAKQAKKIKDAGYKALKCHAVFPLTCRRMNRSVEDEIVRGTAEKIRTIRETVGTGVDILLDVHNYLDIPHAVKMARALEPYDILFFEDPIRQEESPMSYKMLRNSTRTPIATGENLYNVWGFRNYLEIQAIDFALPDICHCGGLTQAKKIAAIAEAYHIPLCPHNCNSPLSTIISAHACASIPNFLYLELFSEDYEPPWRDKVISPPLKVEDGRLILPDKPGYGVELNEQEITKHPYDPKLGWPTEKLYDTAAWG